MQADLLMLAPLLDEYEQLLARHCSLTRAYTLEEQFAVLGDCPERFKVVVTSGGQGIDPRVLAGLPELGLIAVNGVGVDRIDLAQTGRRNIRVVTTLDVLTDAVADLAIGLTLAVLRQIVVADRFVRSGQWEHQAYPLLGTSLRGQRIGILGLGRIGSAIAERLVPFGARLSYHNRQPVQGCEFIYCSSLLELAGQSDILIVAAAGGEGSRHLVNRQVLEALGSNAIVINVARGTVVDETALAEQLVRGQLGGAGLDVFEQEPKVTAQLLGLENVVLLPHLGSATLQTRQAMAQIVTDAVLGYFKQHSGRG